ncbi:MAG: transposase [Helicobacteraceae bacterium]|nr:transposase [Helicobacteraceae bacterium]
MEMKRLNVGIDFAKDKFDICVLKENVAVHYEQFENNLKGFKRFLKYFNVNHIDYVPYIGFESTSTYCRPFQKFLSDNSLPQLLINPLRIKGLKNSMVIQGKTDKTDSLVISSYLKNIDDNSFLDFYSLDNEKLHRYNSTLRHLVGLKQQLKNFYKSINFGLEEDDDISILLTSLRKHIEKLEKQLQKDSLVFLVKIYPVTKDIKKDIQGVGEKLLLSLIPRIYSSVGNYKDKQIIAFIGLNPVKFESGTIKYKEKLNKFGFGHIKKQLYMCAMVARQHNPILKTYSERLVALGKPQKVIIVAVMRKLLLAIIGMIKKSKNKSSKELLLTPT